MIKWGENKQRTRAGIAEHETFHVDKFVDCSKVAGRRCATGEIENADKSRECCLHNGLQQGTEFDPEPFATSEDDIVDVMLGGETRQDERMLPVQPAVLGVAQLRSQVTEGKRVPLRNDRTHVLDIVDKLAAIKRKFQIAFVDVAVASCIPPHKTRIAVAQGLVRAAW
jgi:hypothetical protein